MKSQSKSGKETLVLIAPIEVKADLEERTEFLRVEASIAYGYVNCSKDTEANL